MLERAQYRFFDAFADHLVAEALKAWEQMTDAQRAGLVRPESQAAFLSHWPVKDTTEARFCCLVSFCNPAAVYFYIRVVESPETIHDWGMAHALIKMQLWEMLRFVIVGMIPATWKAATDLCHWEKLLALSQSSEVIRILHYAAVVVRDPEQRDAALRWLSEQVIIRGLTDHLEIACAQTSANPQGEFPWCLVACHDAVAWIPRLQGTIFMLRLSAIDNVMDAGAKKCLEELLKDGKWRGQCSRSFPRFVPRLRTLGLLESTMAHMKGRELKSWQTRLARLPVVADPKEFNPDDFFC